MKRLHMQPFLLTLFLPQPAVSTWHSKDGLVQVGIITDQYKNTQSAVTRRCALLPSGNRKLFVCV